MLPYNHNIYIQGVSKRSTHFWFAHFSASWKPRNKIFDIFMVPSSSSFWKYPGFSILIDYKGGYGQKHAGYNIFSICIFYFNRARQNLESNLKLQSHWNTNTNLRIMFFCLLPHSAPSWILSLSENFASSILQDGATEWHYSYHVPATLPTANFWNFVSPP